MTLKDIAKQLTTAVQTVPNLVQILRDGLEQVEAGSDVTHEYSTNEQIVGKWIDGSDVYEKVITTPAQISITTSWSTIYSDSDIADANQIIDVKLLSTGGVYGGISYKVDSGNLQAATITSSLSFLAGTLLIVRYTKAATE